MKTCKCGGSDWKYLGVQELLRRGANGDYTHPFKDGCFQNTSQIHLYNCLKCGTTVSMSPVEHQKLQNREAETSREKEAMCEQLAKYTSDPGVNIDGIGAWGIDSGKRQQKNLILNRNPFIE